MARPPALTGTPDLGALIRSLKRRWLMALSLGLILSAGLAIAGWTVLSPKHMAFTQVHVASRNGSLLSDRTDSRSDFNTYLKGQAGRIRSRPVLEAALRRDEVRKLNLEKRYPDVLLWLDEELKVEFQLDNEWIRVSLGHEDPEDGKVIVNAITKAYMETVVLKEAQTRSDDVSALEKHYTEANNKLRSKNDQLQELRKQLKTLDVPSIKVEHEILQGNLSLARTQHGQISLQLAQARGRLETLKAQEKLITQSATTPEAALDEAALSDPAIRMEQARIEKADTLMKYLETNVRDHTGDTRYIQARNRVRDAESAIEARKTELRQEIVKRLKNRTQAEYDNRVVAFQAELQSLTSSEVAARAEVERLAREVAKVGAYSTEAENLRAEIERDGKLVETLNGRLQMAQLELLARPRVTIPQEAALQSRDMKKQVLGSGLGGFAGLVLACFGVAWWEFRRRRVHSADEVANGLGIAVVGSVPASADVELMINASPDHHLQGHNVLESVDAIRTLLLRSAHVDSTRVLMVTSADVGEGKTTLASHLASSLSRAGRKTLLIDGDLRQPAVHQLFEVAMVPGFSEVLLGEVDTVDSILPTNVDGLMVMPAGEWDREVVQSLARGGAQGVLEKLKEEFDFIVVDSPPVLATTDSLLIGQNVDAVILSVLRDVSETPKVYAAAQRLQSIGVRVLGAVVSGTDPDESYFGLGYNTSAA